MKKNAPLNINLESKLNALYEQKVVDFKQTWNRLLPFSEMIVDRWDKAKKLGFDKNVSIYDNAFVFGDVSIGSTTWVGPYTILDGSGGKLIIGKNCSISAGVHIYTHDSVNWAVSGGKSKYQTAPVSIGNNCYIGPYAVITKGVTIGKRCIIGAYSLVNSNIPDGSFVFGQPAKVKGTVRYKRNGLVEIMKFPTTLDH